MAWSMRVRLLGSTAPSQRANMTQTSLHACYSWLIPSGLKCEWDTSAGEHHGVSIYILNFQAGKILQCKALRQCFRLPAGLWYSA